MRAHLMICFQLKVLSSFPQTDSNSSFRLRIPSQLPKYCFSDTMWLLRILLQQVFQSNSQTGPKPSKELRWKHARDVPGMKHKP